MTVTDPGPATTGPAKPAQARMQVRKRNGDAEPVNVNKIVSQTLRYLRATQSVTGSRDGRIIRYLLADAALAALVPAGATPE